MTMVNAVTAVKDVTKMKNEVLNPDVICADCNIETTPEGEWIGDVYMCDSMQQYCLNCCGCEDHEGEAWY